MSLALPGMLGLAEVVVAVAFYRRNGWLKVTGLLDEASAAGKIVFLKETSGSGARVSQRRGAARLPRDLLQQRQILLAQAEADWTLPEEHGGRRDRT